MGTAQKLRPAGSLTRLEVKQLALDALVDERTLRKALAGGTILGISRERIRRVLAVRGLLHLLPAEEAR